MSPLTGWHPYRVFCNQHLIASFPTKALQEAFIKERAARYPKNEYTGTLD